jgi:hypothetical protein
MKPNYIYKTRQFKLPNSQVQAGFTTAIALSFGLFICAIGMAFVSQGFNSKNLVTTKTTKAKSLSAAEIGVTQYQSFLFNNPDLAVYPDCVGPRDASGVCPDTSTTLSWSNAGTIPGVTSSMEITNAAQTSWQNVDPNNSRKGQYRLLSYSFVSDDSSNPYGVPGKATLMLEGRVKPKASGNEDEALTSSTTRLEVSFQVKPKRNLKSGFWISCNAGSSVNTSSLIQSDIKDSTPITSIGDPPCGANSSPSKVSQLKAQQPLATIPYTYEENSPESLPSLPSEGELANVPTTGVCTITNELGSRINSSLTFTPNNCPSASGTYYTYHFKNTMDVYLGSGVHITVDAPGKTIKWYVEGDLKVHHDPSTLKVTPGTTLIIYAHGKVQFEGSASIGGALQNSGTPDNLQIYKYSSDEMKISGGSAFNAFIFAPFSQVTVTDANTIQGVIGAKSYVSTSNGDFVSTAANADCEKLPDAFCDLVPGKKHITAITSWQEKSR